MHVTVLGATGGIGRATTLELATRGHSVRAAARAAAAATWPDGVTATPTDLTDPISAREACAGADVVVMAAQVPYPRWRTDLAPMFDTAADAAATAGARLVVVDNLYAYGTPDGAITEATPERPDTRKGAVRAEIARRLLARHAAGELRATIGRFSDYYGPHADNSLVWMLGIAPALRGRTVRTYLDADQPHTFAYLPDAAAAFAAFRGIPWVARHLEIHRNAAPVGVVNSPTSSHAASGTPTSRFTVAGAGTGMTP